MATVLGGFCNENFGPAISLVLGQNSLRKLVHPDGWVIQLLTAPQHLVCRAVPSLHINHMQMSIIEVFICRRLHMNTSMIFICIWLICRLGTALHTKCCGAVPAASVHIEAVFKLPIQEVGGAVGCGLRGVREFCRCLCVGQQLECTV